MATKNKTYDVDISIRERGTIRVAAKSKAEARVKAKERFLRRYCKAVRLEVLSIELPYDE